MDLRCHIRMRYRGDGVNVIIVKYLRGCVTVLEIVFVGQCEIFFCLDFVHFFPLAAKLIVPRTGCQFFKKKGDFSDTYPLKVAMLRHFLCGNLEMALSQNFRASNLQIWYMACMTYAQQILCIELCGHLTLSAISDFVNK